MMNFGNMGWGMAYWWIGGLIMMALFVWFLYTLFGRDTVDSRYHTETARDILTKRYAHGDVTKEEYDSILKDI